MDGLSYLMIRLKVMWKTIEFFWTTFFFNAEEGGSHLLFLINKTQWINWNGNYKSIKNITAVYKINCKIPKSFETPFAIGGFFKNVIYTGVWKFEWPPFKLRFTFTPGLHVRHFFFLHNQIINRNHFIRSLDTAPEVLGENILKNYAHFRELGE